MTGSFASAAFPERLRPQPAGLAHLMLGPPAMRSPLVSRAMSCLSFATQTRQGQLARGAFQDSPSIPDCALTFYM